MARHADPVVSPCKKPEPCSGFFYGAGSGLTGSKGYDYAIDPCVMAVRLVKVRPLEDQRRLNAATS